jgi:uncharacterized protein YndB with AHSA1/START domain
MRFALRHEDLSFVDRAPAVVRSEVLIEASPEAVWPAFADEKAWPQWFAGVHEVRFTSPAPHGVGSTRFVHVEGFRVNERLLAFDVDRRFAFRVENANLPMLMAMVEVITLEPIGDGTRVVYRQALWPKWWFRPLLPIMRRRMESGLRRGLAGLAPWVATAAGRGSAVTIAPREER